MLDGVSAGLLAQPAAITTRSPRTYAFGRSFEKRSASFSK